MTPDHESARSTRIQVAPSRLDNLQLQIVPVAGVVRCSGARNMSISPSQVMTCSIPTTAESSVTGQRGNWSRPRTSRRPSRREGLRLRVALVGFVFLGSSSAHSNSDTPPPAPQPVSSVGNARWSETLGLILDESIPQMESSAPAGVLVLSEGVTG